MMNSCLRVRESERHRTGHGDGWDFHERKWGEGLQPSLGEHAYA